MGYEPGTWVVVGGEGWEVVVEDQGNERNVDEEEGGGGIVAGCNLGALDCVSLSRTVLGT